MAWIDKYTFSVSHPTQGSATLNPVIEDLTLSWGESADFIFLRKVVDTELVLKGSDYDYFDAIDNLSPILRAQKTDITITVDNAGTPETIFEGFVSLAEGQWNKRQREIILKIEPNDKYSCILDNWETEYNVLNATNFNEASVLVGKLEALTCSDFTYTAPPILAFFDETQAVGTCINPAEGWVILREYYIEIEGIDTIRHTTWVREKVTGAPSIPFGTGWINLGGGTYVREPEVSASFTVSILEETSTTYQYEAYKQVVGAEIARDPSGAVATAGFIDLEPTTNQTKGFLYYRPFSLDNGVDLEEVLEILKADCDGLNTIRSNFFRINEDVIPITDPYIAAVAGFDKVVVWQKSDVIFANAFNNASRAEITLKDLLTQLRNIFNVEWDIDDVSGEFFIEHISEFEGSNGLDLTVPPYSEMIEGFENYSYQSVPVPRREVFTWMDKDVVSDYFKGEPIVYNEASATDDDLEINADKVSTDFTALVSYPDSSNPEGLFLGAVGVDGSENYLNFEDGKINGHLSFTKLHDNYWTFGRPYPVGTLNGVLTTFDSYERFKEQETIRIRIDISTLLSFDPSELVKTQYGWGKVSRAEYSAKNSELTLTIRHDL
jgi:hypothetical protein